MKPTFFTADAHVLDERKISFALFVSELTV